MKITVTQEDIDKAKNLRGVLPCSIVCPVALAMHRITGLEWSVGNISACSNTDSTIAIPDFVQQFIYDFDTRRKVLPLEFEATER